MAQGGTALLSDFTPDAPPKKVSGTASLSDFVPESAGPSKVPGLEPIASHQPISAIAAPISQTDQQRMEVAFKKFREQHPPSRDFLPTAPKSTTPWWAKVLGDEGLGKVIGAIGKGWEKINTPTADLLAGAGVTQEFMTRGITGYTQEQIEDALDHPEQYGLTRTQAFWLGFFGSKDASIAATGTSFTTPVALAMEAGGAIGGTLNKELQVALKEEQAGMRTLDKARLTGKPELIQRAEKDLAGIRASKQQIQRWMAPLQVSQRGAGAVFTAHGLGGVAESSRQLKHAKTHQEKVKATSEIMTGLGFSILGGMGTFAGAAEGARQPKETVLQTPATPTQAAIGKTSATAAPEATATSTAVPAMNAPPAAPAAPVVPTPAAVAPAPVPTATGAATPITTPALLTERFINRLDDKTEQGYAKRVLRALQLGIAQDKLPTSKGKITSEREAKIVQELTTRWGRDQKLRAPAKPAETPQAAPATLPEAPKPAETPAEAPAAQTAPPAAPVEVPKEPAKTPEAQTAEDYLKQIGREGEEPQIEAVAPSTEGGKGVAHGAGAASVEEQHRGEVFRVDAQGRAHSQGTTPDASRLGPGESLVRIGKDGEPEVYNQNGPVDREKAFKGVKELLSTREATKKPETAVTSAAEAKKDTDFHAQATAEFEAKNGRKPEWGAEARAVIARANELKEAAKAKPAEFRAPKKPEEGVPRDTTERRQAAKADVRDQISALDESSKELRERLKTATGEDKPGLQRALDYNTERRKELVSGKAVTPAAKEPEEKPVTPASPETSAGQTQGQKGEAALSDFEPEAPKPAETAAPARSYDDVQKSIDAREDELEKQGVDVLHLYSPEDLEGWRRMKVEPPASWSPMPADLVELYKQRNSIGAAELEKEVRELSGSLGKTGLSEGEIGRILKYYAIDPKDTSAIAQSHAGEWAPQMLKEPVQRQVEEAYIRLAAERGIPMDDTDDLWRDAKTTKDAHAAVKAVLTHFLGEKAPELKQLPAAPEPVKASTFADHLYDQIGKGEMPSDNNALRKMVSDFDGKPADNARLKEAQEEFELAMVRRSRDLVAEGGDPRATFDKLVDLYGKQPNLNVRTSTSIENQAYSTPAPLAFLADRLAGVDKNTKVYEPTAGNGMLLIGAEPKNSIANELETNRAKSLKTQGFDVREGDALKADVPAKSVDAVVTNPPFGSVKGEDGKPTKVDVDGYKVGQIDHLIAARALDAMKDDGKATLILGASREPGGRSTDDRTFFNWLYSHYNVTGHFEIDGSLYERQGAGWPVRIISINGRQLSEKVSPAEGTVPRVNTWEDVYGKFSESLAAQQRPTGERGPISTVPGPAGANEPPSVPRPAGETPAAARPAGPEGGGAPPEVVGGAPARPVPSGAGRPAAGVARPDDGVRPDADTPKSDRLESDRPDRGTPPERTPRPGGDRGGVGNLLAAEENQFQLPYTPSSSKKDVGVLIPTNMKAPLEQAMAGLEDRVGDIDKFVMEELGYTDPEEFHDAFMGLQVDAIGAAIDQMKNGRAVVVGDQTGIGKGRQAAAIIRWAVKQGQVPVFITRGDNLFTPMYYDILDIGADNVRPFVVNKDGYISLLDETKAFANEKAGHAQALKKIVETGQLPDDRNAVFLTYSQINRANNVQQELLRRIAPRAVFVLDEAHNAGGTSNTGAFMQDLLHNAQGVTYLSATYAKRPDNMPLYFKTDMGQAIADPDALIQAMKNGGLPLQTVVSNNLVKAGQFFRRERSYSGIDMPFKVDTARGAEHARIADATTEALRAIVDADRNFHNIYVAGAQQAIRTEGGAVGGGGSKASTTLDHSEFSAVVHNFVRQMLLGMKAESAVDEAVEALKRGEKPLIAVDNTMGSFLSAYVGEEQIAQGSFLRDFDYRTVLSRALKRTRYIRVTDKFGNEHKVYVSLEELDPQTRAAYDQAQKVIDKLNVNLPISPIDWIRAKLVKAGYSVAEITGRELAVDYSDPENPKLTQVPVEERKNRVDSTRRFNDGRLDALIMNVAGSQGISLHASEKFADQKPRHMIVVQPAQDINVFMQMLGRIHRTGQVKLPRYTILLADIPAEKRPMAVLSKKMKSLNANTSSNVESATSIKATDMLNKYGDSIVGNYLHDNHELANNLHVDPMGENGEPNPDIARKATGRLAVWPVKVQEEFYNEVEQQYNDYIEYLNSTNQNELEPKTFDYDARELRTRVMTEGDNPDSPFGQDGIYGEYSIKSQGTPLTANEAREHMQENLKGRNASQHMNELQSTLEKQYQAYVPTLKSEAAQHLAQELRDRAQMFLAYNKIGSFVSIDIKDDLYDAVITNIHSTHKDVGNPYALSKIKVTLATNGPMRFLSLPATQLQAIVKGARYQDINSLFRASKAETRATAKIATGNLLSVYGELRGTRGTIINFTKADGTVEQGILLPNKFDIGTDVRGDYRLRTPEQAAKLLHSSEHEAVEKLGISSRDGNVRVIQWRGGLTIITPKAKARGGKYFLDRELTKLTGDFVSQGQTMRVDIPRGSERAVLDHLMKKSALYAPPSIAQEARDLAPKRPGEKAKGATGGGTTMRASAFGLDILAKAAVKEYQNEIKPFADKAGTNAKELFSWMTHVIAPRAGVRIRALDSITKHLLGERESHAFIVDETLRAAESMLNKLPKDQLIDFVDNYKNGDPQATPEMQEISDFMRNTDENTYRQIVESQVAHLSPRAQRLWNAMPETSKVQFLHQIATFKADTTIPPGPLKELAKGLLTYKENHYRVLWKKLPVSGVERARPGVKTTRPLQGTKGFMRQSTLDDMSEGIMLGGEPTSYNPVTMFKVSQADAWRYITAQRVWQDARRQGARQFVRVGKSAPEGFVPIEDRIGDVAFPASSGEGMVHPGKWYLREDWARLLNNFLGRDYIRENVAGRGLMWTKNQMTMYRLSLSPFHAITESMSSIGGQAGHAIDVAWNEGVRKASFGDISRGMKEAIKTPIAPWLDVRRGESGVRYIVDKAEFLRSQRGQDFIRDNPEADRILQEFFDSGGRLGLHPDEFSSHIGKFMQARANNQYMKAALHSVPALNQLLLKPLFNYYIPRLKLGMFLRDYSRELVQREADINAGVSTRGEIGRRVWDSIEDQMGEMNWDARFWNRTFKSSIQFSFRAFAWFAGNFRFVDKAVTGQFNEMLESMRALNERVGAIDPDRVGRAKPSSTPIPRIDPDMAKLIGLAMAYAAVNAAVQFGMTGEEPKDWKDLFAARVGGVDSHGNPNRLTTPAIVFTDWMSLAYHGSGVMGRSSKYLSSKVSDPVNAITQVWSNRDWRDNMIRDPNAPAWEQAKATAKEAIGLPIGLSTAQRLEGEHGAEKYLGIAGFKTAPPEFGMTPAQREMYQYRQEYPQKPLTPKEAEAADFRSKLRRESKESPREFRKDVVKALAQGKITARQLENLTKDERETWLEKAVKNTQTPVDEALHVFELANPEERRKLRPVLFGRIKDIAKEKDGPKKKELWRKFWELIRGSSKAQTKKPEPAAMPNEVPA